MGTGKSVWWHVMYVVSGQADRRSYSSWLELFQAVLVKGKKEGGKLRNAHLGEFPIVDFSRLNVMV